jgi:hypothetical protein
MKSNLIVALLIIVVALAITGNIDFASVFNQGKYPHYAITEGVSKLSCNPDSKYDKQFYPYKTFLNVKKINNPSQADSLYDNYVFADFEIFDKNGKSPRGLSTENYVASIGDGIKAQEKCDGTLDCNFGFTKEDWMLDNGKCYVVQTYYIIENNECQTFKTIKPNKDDLFETNEDCIKNLVENPTQESSTQESSTQESSTQESSWIDKINRWFDNLFTTIGGWFK